MEKKERIETALLIIAGVWLVMAIISIKIDFLLEAKDCILTSSIFVAASLVLLGIEK